MTTERVQTRVDEDMADDIETFQEAGYMNQSEAVRKLLRDGLDANRPLNPDTEQGTGETTATRRHDSAVNYLPGNALVLGLLTLNILLAGALLMGAL